MSFVEAQGQRQQQRRMGRAFAVLSAGAAGVSEIGDPPAYGADDRQPM